MQINALCASIKDPVNRSTFGVDALPRHLRRCAFAWHLNHVSAIYACNSQSHIQSALSRTAVFRRATSHKPYKHRRRPNHKLQKLYGPSAISLATRLEVPSSSVLHNTCMHPQLNLCAPLSVYDHVHDAQGEWPHGICLPQNGSQTMTHATRVTACGKGYLPLHGVAWLTLHHNMWHRLIFITTCGLGYLS